MRNCLPVKAIEVCAHPIQDYRESVLKNDKLFQPIAEVIDVFFRYGGIGPWRPRTRGRGCGFPQKSGFGVRLHFCMKRNRTV